MHIKHFKVVLSSIVLLFLVVVSAVLKTGSSLPTNNKSGVLITPIPVDSATLPDALQKIQNKARQSNSDDLQLVGAPIGINPGSVIQPTPATTEASLTPVLSPTLRPVQ